jgi:YD repeat-containing protein
MNLLVDITANPAADGELRKVPDVVNRNSSRATLPLWALVLVLGVSAGESALAADQTIFTYDALGRLQSVQYQNGAQVTYVYDPAGNRTQVTNTPGSGSPNPPPLPQQRRKLAAIQAVLSILLGQ